MEIRCCAVIFKVRTKQNALKARVPVQYKPITRNNNIRIFQRDVKTKSHYYDHRYCFCYNVTWHWVSGSGYIFPDRSHVNVVSCTLLKFCWKFITLLTLWLNWSMWGLWPSRASQLCNGIKLNWFCQFGISKYYY